MRSLLIPIIAFAAAVPVCAQSPVSRAPANPLDGDRAFGYLEQVCELGPRPSGSDAMRRQIELLSRHFESLGGDVHTQSFYAPHPKNRGRVRMTNLVVRYRPELKRRVLLCAHYDTRPLPDRDPNPQARRAGRFIGANDGGSGTAVLMELAHLMPQLSGDVGVDLVLFDGEELIYRENNRDIGRYFLGSTWFARKYRSRKEDYTYEWGVLLDMVGDADLQLFYERNSWASRKTRPLVRSLWEKAAELGVAEFKPRSKHTVQDDHLPLNAVGIPTCDIIDFDYPFWHTEQDIVEKCSGESLAKVGWVVWEWLRELDAASVTSKPTTTASGATE